MMKVAIIFSSLLVACVAYWPQDGFDAASSYASIPLDNTTISPIAALTGGIATSNLAYFEVAATESVSISSQGVMYIPVANKDNGAPSAYIIAHDLKADSVNKTVWLEYINSTGWVPNATDADTVLEIKYTALHEPSSTLFVPVHAGQDLVYFMGLNYTSGAPMWIAHWPCNINSAPRVIASGYIAIMCDNVVHEIEIPTKLNYTHPSQNQPNVTTYALPEVATPYQILATDNSSLYAIRFNGCELDFNEITIPNADLFRPAINITLPANCTAPSSCIAAGNDVFGCGMYLIDLKTSKVMNSTVYLSVHAPDMWIGFTPIGHAAPSVVVYNEDMTVASLSIPLNELRGDNVTITSMAITLERSTGTILVSAAADVFMLPRQLFIYAFNMTGALMYRSQSSHLDDTMWSSVAAGPLIPTDAGSIVMVSRNSSSLFEFTCCSGNGICNTNGNCTCNTNYVSNNCSLFCDSTRCGNHSTGCNDKAVCQCMPGYFGTFCDVYCDNTTCNGHGRCDLGDGSCICDAGYVTPLNNFTTVRGCFGMCSNTSCNMHGECTYLNATVLPAFGQAWTSAGCACHSGFYGDVCTTFCDANATCNNHGTCVNTTMLNMTHVNNTDAGQCQCFAGWYNADCNTYCVANDTCHGAGTCNTDGSCACSDSSMFGFVKSDCTRSVNLSDGAFIGIIVAISVAVLALIILIICCCRRRDAGYTAIRNEGIRNTGN